MQIIFKNKNMICHQDTECVSRHLIHSHNLYTLGKKNSLAQQLCQERNKRLKEKLSFRIP